MSKFVFVGIALGLFACFYPVAAQNRGAAPEFTDYPVTSVFSGRNAPVKLVSANDKTYRTRLREAAREEADFAGQYKVALIGCGTNCMLAAVINLRTGRVYWFPDTINQALSDEVDEIIGEEPVMYGIDSKLLVFPTLKDHDSDRFVHLQYYVFEGTRFRLVRSIKKRRSDI